MLITLGSGNVTLVSEEDYAFLNQWRWQEQRSKHRRTSVVRRRLHASEDFSRPAFLMHRVIADRMGILHLRDLSMDVDHINHNSLDNRRENLRSATRTQNMANIALRRGNRAGFKGVNFHKQTKKWHARISLDHKTLSLGVHVSPEDAARAYDVAARQLFGEYACLNFP